MWAASHSVSLVGQTGLLDGFCAGINLVHLSLELGEALRSLLLVPSLLRCADLLPLLTKQLEDLMATGAGKARVVLGHEQGIRALWALGQAFIDDGLLRLASQECQATAGLVG
jgi:hypothetical protein